MKNKNVLIGILIALVIILLAWNIYTTNRVNNLLKNYQTQQHQEIQTNKINRDYKVDNSELDKKQSVKVLSPNGGEKYYCGVGGTICNFEVKWSSINLSETSEIFVALQKEGSSENIYLTISTSNSGKEVFVLPNDINILPTGNYKIIIGSPAARVMQDSSDGFFKITRVYPPTN